MFDLGAEPSASQEHAHHTALVFRHTAVSQEPRRALGWSLTPSGTCGQIGCQTLQLLKVSPPTAGITHQGHSDRRTFVPKC